MSPSVELSSLERALTASLKGQILDLRVHVLGSHGGVPLGPKAFVFLVSSAGLADGVMSQAPVVLTVCHLRHLCSGSIRPVVLLSPRYCWVAYLLGRVHEGFCQLRQTPR